jgi:prephenate dehydratase
VSATPIAVAIQGEAGSFSHAAALALFGAELRLVSCAAFADLFEAVASGAADRGVVPIENSLAGSVHENDELLAAHALSVVAETRVRVRHCLVARPGTALADVRRVASHPVALAQCRRFLAAHPAIEAVPAWDTAGSVRDLLAGRLDADAAIASALAAERYGGTVLAAGLEDHAENWTRFLALAREPAAPGPGAVAKTSLVFRLPNVPGSLHRALGAFAARGLDLARIESRPIPGRPWEYAFHLDVIEGAGGRLDEALAELRAHAREVRVLGTYAPAPEAPAGGADGA